MPANPSFYFNLFKKFQVLNHVPSSSVHGNAGAPAGNFNLTDPNAANGVFGTADLGTPLTAGDSTPAHSPLWAILNARAGGTPGFASVTIPGGAQAGSQWPAMPPGVPPAWNEFQLTAPAPKLVDAFGTWITNGQARDIPNGVIAARPPQPIAAPLDTGRVSLFVCSFGADNGVRPGGVPPNFWATSLIFFVDAVTGNTVFPATLTAASEYYLAAVIGNRGAQNAGRYLNHPPAVEVAASVMVWNTFDSPGVELPSLSNLDVNATNGIYEQYFLRSGEYDIAGWRLNVQTVFNGIIAALNQAVTNGLNLGGLTPEQWVLAQPAHLCAKVVIRGETAGQAFPLFGTDTPDVNRRIAQKNLAPFEAGITATDPNPNIIWKNFIVGQPLFFKLDQGEGTNRLILKHRLPHDATRVFVALPTRTFEHFVRQTGRLAGLEIWPAEKLPAVGRYHGKPFPDAVILRQTADDASIQLRSLDEKEYLGMAVGIEYDMKRVKHGPLGDLTITQHTVVPVLAPKTRCFDLVDKVVGGFTLQVRAVDGHVGPKGHVEYPEKYDG